MIQSVKTKEWGAILNIKPQVFQYYNRWQIYRLQDKT
jgi:hypothetical protein